jgi:alkanesulfonate monooxygenase SsuD/methylene tetrahydromethanopterin reductase-like flavin-dependent oxidoreductase (luciferase family)
MPGLVSDEMLDAYAVIGTYDEIAAKLRARYGHLATSLEFAIPPSQAGDDAMCRELIDGLRRGAA